MFMVSVTSLTLGWGPPYLICEDAVEIAWGPAYRALGSIFVIIFLLYSSPKNIQGVVLACGGGPERGKYEVSAQKREK